MLRCTDHSGPSSKQVGFEREHGNWEPLRQPILGVDLRVIKLGRKQAVWYSW